MNLIRRMARQYMINHIGYSEHVASHSWSLDHFEYEFSSWDIHSRSWSWSMDQTEEHWDMHEQNVIFGIDESAYNDPEYELEERHYSPRTAAIWIKKQEKRYGRWSEFENGISTYLGPYEEGDGPTDSPS